MTPSLPKPLYSVIQDAYKHIDMETNPPFEVMSPASELKRIQKNAAAFEKARESEYRPQTHCLTS